MMSGYLSFCDENAKTKFSDRPFETRHRLSDHPLLQLPALAELARKMDPDTIEYSSGDLQPNQLPEEMKTIDLPPALVIEQIEKCGAWLVLKNVECVPVYQTLLEEILKDAARQAGFRSLEAAGMLNIQGFIFVASANSVTPFHADNEDNMFVHLHGRKFFHVFDNRDRSIVADADLESYPGKHRNLKYKPEFEDKATVYDMVPGEGIFLPHNWPHWVRTGEEYSISMQVTWRSPRVVSTNNLLVANAILRKIGLPQTAPSVNPIWDKVKISVYSVARAAAEPLRRSQKLRQLIHRMFSGGKMTVVSEAEPKPDHV